MVWLEANRIKIGTCRACSFEALECVAEDVAKQRMANGGWVLSPSCSLQQFMYFFTVILPTSLIYAGYVQYRQTGMSWYSFGLNLAVGNIYLAGVLRGICLIHG